MTYETNDFNKDVIEGSFTIPILVDFWAEWCGPCKILGPTLENMASENQNNWGLVKLDIDKHKTIAMEYGVRSIPNVKLFVDGQVVDEFTGALPESQIAQWLEKAIPSKYAKDIESAKQFMIEGDTTKAIELLESVVKIENSNEEARAMLARAHFPTNPVHAEEIISSINLGSEQFDTAEAIKNINKVFSYLENPDYLLDDPVKPLYLKSISDAKSNDLETALTGFIEIIKKNRNYDSDGSRKNCIFIFKILGEEHMITKKYRPLFSSALY